MTHLIASSPNDNMTMEDTRGWQLQSTPRALWSPFDANLRRELIATSDYQLQQSMNDSVHTEFQEHAEQEHVEATEMIPDTLSWQDCQRDQAEPSSAPLYSLDSSNDSPHYAEPQPGYMNRHSPFSFEPSMPGEMSFMEWYPKGEACLTYHNDDGLLESLRDLNVWIIEERCPILAAAFERSRSGPQLYLETLTSATAKPFLRYLYTGTYALKGNCSDLYEDVPTSLLLHCQLYRLGAIYDLPDLKSQAYVNVLRQCEFGCSSPEKPIDLCAAIRFVYEHLSEHDNLIDAIVNYCVACFIRHNLARDEGFRTLAYELRPFHQELCRNSMHREFENETASAIIQMPFKPYKPDTYASREDIVFHFHSNDDDEALEMKKSRGMISRGDSMSQKTVLPLRPSHTIRDTAADESASRDEGFRIVRELKAPSFKSALSAGLAETEYEIVVGPSGADVLSESESDTETLVEVPQASPIRSRELPAAATVAASHLDDGVDSEWTFV